MERKLGGAQTPASVPRGAPIRRVAPRGWVSAAFWFLRLYIAVMLALVVIGFVRGTL